jgi:hypothetical protein
LLSYKFSDFIKWEPRARDVFQEPIFTVLIIWAECRRGPVLLPRTRALHDDVPYCYKWRRISGPIN